MELGGTSEEGRTVGGVEMMRGEGHCKDCSGVGSSLSSGLSIGTSC